MVLAQISYCSRPADGVHLQDTQEILSAAQARNRSACITGCLVYRHDLFVQVLEGDREVLSRVVQKIFADERHRDIVLLGCRRIEQRSFAEWSMGFLALKEVNRELLLKYGASDAFDPAAMDHDAVVGLTMALLDEQRLIATGV